MRVGKALFLALGVLLAAGCGVQATATAGGTTSAHAVTSSGSVVANLRGEPPQLQAGAEAAIILGKFVPPPGAVRLAQRPALPSGSGTAGLVYTTTVHDTGYWRVRGDATALQAWEKAHISRSFSQQDAIGGPPSWSTIYTLPPVPGVDAAREVNAQFYDVGAGETVIMADAMVAWEPTRPATEVVPASATVVTITRSSMAGPSMANPEQATITSAPVVRQLAALVNGLPLSTIGPVPCPSGAGFTLTFRDAAGGPPVAVATGPSGCGAVDFQLNGKDQPGLMALNQNSYDTAVLKIAGLHWPLYSG
jgi:hypothetical protein